MVRPPFIENFIFPVPEAFLPAVEICSDRSAARVDVLAVLDVVVRKKDYLDEIPDFGIAIDHFTDRIDKFDDQLSYEVARRGLTAEDEGARRDRECPIVFDAEVESDDMKDI